MFKKFKDFVFLFFLMGMIFSSYVINSYAQEESLLMVANSKYFEVYAPAGVNSYDILKSHGFIKCTESDFSWIREKHKTYYEYLSWSTRSDGHGGSKGGTMKEFLKRKHERV